MIQAAFDLIKGQYFSKHMDLIRLAKKEINNEMLDVIISEYTLSRKHLNLIFGLIEFEVKNHNKKYEQRVKHLDEIEMLYSILQNPITFPVRDADLKNFAKSPIKRISIDLDGHAPIVITDGELLWNLLYRAMPYLSSYLPNVYQDYIKPRYVERNARKVKGIRMKGHDDFHADKIKALRKLATQLLNYLDKETNLADKYKGDVIINIFNLANCPLGYETPKNAIDSLRKYKAIRKH